MELSEVITDLIEPAAKILMVLPDSPEARVMLLTIGQQESRFQYRRQMGNGPARGFWQFERGGGVKGVYNHKATSGLLKTLCLARKCPHTITDVWEQLEFDDVLACGVARLLLWSDPLKLPAIGDVEGAWNLYANRTWLPGKPHRQTWDGFYAKSLEALGL